MDNTELLFHKEYEQFYGMASTSKAFREFCMDAFGEDFSQDGFSDLKQINRILDYIPNGNDVHILDIGCGNGKMLGYLQNKTGAFIHGFDYSEKAIADAKSRFRIRADFLQGNIGEVEYPQESFDVITSIDTMYFAPDMTKLVEQIMTWLKKDGILFVGYQGGDVMPKTEHERTTEFAKALDAKNITYDVWDITEEVYEMLVRKRQVALLHRDAFEKERNTEWFDLLMMQTECIMESYEKFAEKMARYIYIIKN